VTTATPSTTWRSRLAVAAGHRRVGALGAALIRLAVSSAHARGCTRFLAHVQAQNGPLFSKMRWDTVEEVQLHGRPHLKMQADLDFYPPFETPETGFLALARRPEELAA
jgi:putative N-acetyltransferase (TIGR04045 family)